MVGVEAEERKNYLLTPHPGQIISIFRLLGIGFCEFREKKSNAIIRTFNYLRDKEKEYTKVIKNKLQNNLVQVGTGEGKSLILAVTSCVLVLLGAEVSCVCYSDYLSSRDYDSFKPIFEALNITQNIHYGTFNQICENILNEHGDIRSIVVNFILNKNEEKIKSVSDEIKPRVLLIDEVDVFFTDSFYGNIYTPLALLKDPSINNLTSYLFENRATMLNMNTLEKSKEFLACCKCYAGWEFLIKEACKDMIADLKDFKHDYILKNDKLAYKEQDGISFDVVYGYKTMFSYYF